MQTSSTTATASDPTVSALSTHLHNNSTSRRSQNHSVLIKMSTYVSIGWIPLVKDADSSSAVASLKGLKDQKLATPGLEHAYHGTPTDPNEPKAAEIIDGEFPLRTVQLLFIRH